MTKTSEERAEIVAQGLDGFWHWPDFYRDRQALCGCDIARTGKRMAAYVEQEEMCMHSGCGQMWDQRARLEAERDENE